VKLFRRGRPIKHIKGSKLVQLNVRIRADLKRQIELRALEHGRTLSAEAEHWLERVPLYEMMMSSRRDETMFYEVLRAWVEFADRWGEPVSEEFHRRIEDNTADLPTKLKVALERSRQPKQPTTPNKKA
jgi:hypothetical protein